MTRNLSARIHTGLIVALGLLAFTACQPAPTAEPELPTLAALPSLTPAAVESAVPSATETPLASATPSITPTRTPSPTASRTPTSTIPASVTVEPTLLAIASATALVREAPIFSTLTPLPPGTAQPPGTPQQMADLIITRSQFQQEVNRLLPEYASIQSANLAFAQDAIVAEVTALSGEAFITGRITLSILPTGTMAAISIADIAVNAPEPPEAYVNVAQGDFLLLMIRALDGILRQRLGPDQDLQDIAVTADGIRVSLLVPRP